MVCTSGKHSTSLDILASVFANAVPNEEFSTAEILGYLIAYKRDPVKAAQGANSWVEQECRERRDAGEREKSRKDKNRGSKPAQMCPVRMITATGLVMSRSQKADGEQESRTPPAMIEGPDSPVTDKPMQR